MGLPISINEVKISPHRQTQRPTSQEIPDTVKLTIHTNYHQFIIKRDFPPPNFKIIIVIVGKPASVQELHKASPPKSSEHYRAASTFISLLVV